MPEAYFRAAVVRLSGILFAAGVLLSTVAGPLSAQIYPERPIRLLYPYAAGSGVDAAWRAIAQAASQQLGQSVVFENRPGAAGRNVINAFGSAPKDGYLIGVGTSVEMWLQGLSDPKLVIEPGRDYIPVTLAFKNYQVLLANPSVPFRDVKGLVDFAKANPGQLNLSTAGNGTPGHLTMELLNSVAGIKLIHVPYRGGAPATTAVVGGEVQLSITDAGSRVFVDAGKLLAIATTSTKRWSAYPEVPTFQEQGYPTFDVSVPIGLIAPPGTPDAVIRRLNKAFTEALKAPEVVALLGKLGMDAQSNTPEEYTAYIKSEMKRWGPIVQSSGLKF